MPSTFILRNTASDLTGGVAFNVQLLQSTGTLVNLSSGNLASGVTRVGRAYTEPGIPTNGTSTGQFQVEVNVVTAQTSVTIRIDLHRINSAGTIQATATGTAQASSPVGIKTFTFSSPALGTWAAGDRLRVDYVFIRGTGGGNVAVSIGTNTISSEVRVPWANLETLNVVGTSTITITDELDSAAQNEAVTVTAAATVTKTDSVGITANTSVTATSTVTKTDSLVIVDNRQATATSTVSSTDSITGTEVPIVTVTSTVTATDSLGAAEQTESVLLAGVTTVSSSDGLNVQESPSLSIAASVSKTEVYTPSELLQVVATSTVTATSIHNIVEFLQVDILGAVDLTENIHASEVANIVASAIVTTQDNLQILISGEPRPGRTLKVGSGTGALNIMRIPSIRKVHR